jgi:tripartite ATP-independent transporter DctP family solute receptor
MVNNKKYLSLFCACLFIVSVTYSAAEAKTVNIKFASANTEDSYHGVFGLAFKKHAEQMSNGRIKVDVFLGGQMGSEQDNVNQVSTGIVNMSTMAVNNVTPFAPIVGFCTLPYMWNRFGEAWAVLDSPLKEKLNEIMIKQGNFRSLAWMTGGFRVLTNSRKPVRTLEDLKGLRIRVPKNEIMIQAYKAWGINPVPMAWTEVFNALQQKVVDGQDNPYATIPAMKFYEVQKYVTNIHYILWIGPALVNEKWYQGLEPDIRKMVDEAALKAQKEEREWAIGKEGTSALEAVEQGMEITVPANNEKEWIEKAKSIWPNFYDKIGGKAFVDEVVAFLENHRKK